MATRSTGTRLVGKPRFDPPISGLYAQRMPRKQDVIEAPSGIVGHLSQDDAIWAPFNPTTLVKLAREQAGALPGLPELLASCTRGGWTCTAYVQFVRTIPPGGVYETVILESADAEYALDVDQAGKPLGVELLHVALSHRHSD
jgi:hypothetical protein